MRAISSVTFDPGIWPPSPGLLPCAILISSSCAAARYSVVTPKRPDATCLTAQFAQSPLGRGLYRAGSSPPSPLLLLAPSRFIAIARVSCASLPREPCDIDETTNRRAIASAGSTPSTGSAVAGLNSRRSRSVVGGRCITSHA